MKAFKHFDQMDKFMSDKHEIVTPFVRNSTNSSSQISAAVEDSAVSSQEHLRVQAQETEGPTESLPGEGKGGKVKSPRKGKGKQKVGEDDRWYDLLEKQTEILEASQKGQEQYFKFLNESDDRGRDLLISAIRELDTLMAKEELKGKLQVLKRKSEHFLTQGNSNKHLTTFSRY